MKIRLICVGKMKNTSLRALASDYAERTQRFATLEVIEVRDGKSADAIGRLREEGQALRELLGGKGGKGFSHAVLWDEAGENLDTKKFSALLERSAALDFVIGSSHGVAADLKKDIPRHLRLSSFTFTHEWARALALEQIYRAFCLLRGFPYHH